MVQNQAAAAAKLEQELKEARSRERKAEVWQASLKALLEVKNNEMGHMQEAAQLKADEWEASSWEMQGQVRRQALWQALWRRRQTARGWMAPDPSLGKGSTTVALLSISLPVPAITFGSLETCSQCLIIDTRCRHLHVCCRRRPVWPPADGAAEA